MATNSNYKQIVIDRLKKLIASRGQTLTTVEKKLGYRRGYVAEALRGRKTLTLELILEVLEALNVEPGAFFRGDKGLI